jgi:predicted nucleotidyltransferase component of viral defense system
MSDSDRYHAQVALLIRILPHVVTEDCFAIKGGTAINLFLRDLPRLSVDIDLTYLPIEPRDTSLDEISTALKRIGEAITKTIPGSKIFPIPLPKTPYTIRLIIQAGETQVKIEPNLVIRGTVFDATERELAPSAQNLFQAFITVLTCSLPDIYGGKICAALDRQHPRDLFDIKLLLENEGITPEIRKAFIVYLVSHNRPMHELLAPRPSDLRLAFSSEFVGMTRVPIELDELLLVRNNLASSILAMLTDDERAFIISMKQGEPNWSLLGLSHIENLPAIRWKLQNIQKMDRKKHSEALTQLRTVLKE